MKTYNEQFNILTEAYLQDKVEPFMDCGCFVGNMLDTGDWSDIRSIDRVCDRHIPLEDTLHSEFLAPSSIALAKKIIKGNGYTPLEIVTLEREFMCTYIEKSGDRLGDCRREIDEDALFAAFERTLEVLKQIHIAKGEIIDETPVFVKRDLSKKAELV